MSIPGLPSAGVLPPAVGKLGSAAPLGNDAPSPYGMTMWFNVSVPRLDGGLRSLGLWSGCSGLEVQLTPEGPFDEGGNYTSPRYLPGKLTYGKVTLERVMTKDGSQAVRTWLEQQAAQWVAGAAAQPPWPTTVVIQLYGGPGRNDLLIHQWELQEAVPVGWVLPALSTSGSGGIALEKLTLAHSGFLKPVEQVPGHQLELHEKGNAGSQLGFLYNPAKITLKKTRQASSQNKKALLAAGEVQVDPNSLAVTLNELRIEGEAPVAAALSTLERWLEIEPPAARPSTPPTWTAATPSPNCRTCGQPKKSPVDAAAAGTPRVLQVIWGQSSGGMPGEMVLKGFDLTYTRFTPSGQPSRATVSLTLQEHKIVDTPAPKPKRDRQQLIGAGRQPAAGRADDRLRTGSPR